MSRFHHYRQKLKNLRNLPNLINTKVKTMDYRKAFFLDGKGDIGAKKVDTLSQAGASVLATDIDATVAESLVKNI
jgi:hypothetical protein